MASIGTRSAQALTLRLAKLLSQRLSTRYQVTSRYDPVPRDRSPGVGAQADLLIYDIETSSSMIVEIKGSPNTDLPLAILSVIKRMKKTFEELNPTIVLISLSRISSRLWNQLSFENVSVLEFHNDEDELVSDLIALLAQANDGRPTFIYPEVWYERGRALIELGRHKEAVTAFDQAVRLRPDYPEVWNDKGWALIELGEYEEAVNALEQALRRKPNYPDAWYNKGLALGKMKQHEAAKSWLCLAWRARDQISDRSGMVAEALRELGYDPERCNYD